MAKWNYEENNEGMSGYSTLSNHEYKDGRFSIYVVSLMRDNFAIEVFENENYGSVMNRSFDCIDRVYDFINSELGVKVTFSDLFQIV